MEDYPWVGDVVRGLSAVRESVGADRCYLRDGRFLFDLGDGFSLAVSSDVAGRLRLDACYRGATVDSLWSVASDTDRLDGLARSLANLVAVI